MTPVPTLVVLAGLGWIAAVGTMAALWAVQLRTKNAGIVDAGWTALVAGLAIFYATQAQGMPGRRLAIASMMGSWGARLTVYLLYDRILGKPEEGRYAELRKTQARPDTWFFWFFQAQAAAAVLFSTPALFASVNSAPDFAFVEFAGAALWIVGFAGETTADRQLLRFRMDPDNSGRTCQEGLWRYSRHPNYFFEWMIWVANALFAAASPWGWVSVACPAVMLYRLFRVTGIPATEAQALRSRGDAYRRYQETTSVFLPWRPRAVPADSSTPVQE
jgi:steroid 5-alpha reductase family enzyme